VIIIPTLFISSGVFCKSVSVINSKFLHSVSWVSNSAKDPEAIFKNLMKSLLLLLPEPSAILEGTEIAERLIWEVIPYSSSLEISLLTHILALLIAWLSSKLQDFCNYLTFLNDKRCSINDKLFHLLFHYQLPLRPEICLLQLYEPYRQRLMRRRCLVIRYRDMPLFPR